MNRIAAVLVTLSVAFGGLLVAGPAQASQDWPSPPSSIVLTHVEGSMSTGWYVAGTRYDLPVFFTLPRIGVIRNVTCATDATGTCEASWTRFYRELALFRDAETIAKGHGGVRRLPEQNR
jgi:hypothetical protein